MKQNKIIGIVAGILFLWAASSMAEGPDPSVNEARALVEQKAYDAALGMYEKISDQLRSQPGLLIEWARVYTYADRHSQAIELFEDVRKRYPEHEKEILKELADQYKWNGQFGQAIGTYKKALEFNTDDFGTATGLAEALAWDHRYQEAIAEYDLILQTNPNSIPALLGKAEVLSWEDRLEKANQLYEKVLTLDSLNLSAQNGLARNAVWQGYHQQGIRRYLQILRENEGNSDSLEGLAFAYHWDGQEGQSLKTLDDLLPAHPERKAASDLFGQIQGLKAFHVNQSNRYSQDTNELAVYSSRWHGGRFFNDKAAWGTTYEWARYRQTGKPVLEAERGGIDLQERFNEYWEANTYLYVTKYSANGFTPLTTNTWLTLRPDDFWRLDFGYDRETFEDITALDRKIIVDSGVLSVDLRPDRFWLFSSKYKRGSYSDGNTQDTVFSRVEFRLRQTTPYVKLYFNDYFSRWGEQKDSGYFNPHSIHSDAIGIYSSWQMRPRLFAEGQTSVGFETQDPKSNHPTYFSAVGLAYQFQPDWSVSLRGEYFDAQDSNPAKDYSKYTIWLGVRYNFGQEPQRVYEGQQPQRPTAR